MAEGLLEALGVPAAAAADLPSSLAADTSGLEGQGLAGLAASFAALEEALEEAAEAAEAGAEAAGRAVERQQALSQVGGEGWGGEGWAGGGVGGLRRRAACVLDDPCACGLPALFACMTWETAPRRPVPGV